MPIPSKKTPSKNIKPLAHRKFRLKEKTGSHAQGGRLYRPGDVVASPHDLTKQFVNKFEEVAEDVPATKSLIAADASGMSDAVPGVPDAPIVNAAPTDEVLVPVDDEETTEEDEDEESDEDGPEGVDVTDKFPKAAEQDFKVFKHDGQYNLYDAEDTTKVIGSATNKAGVDAAVAEALKAK